MIRKLIYLNGLAILMVVINHAVWFPIQAPEFWREDFIHLYPAGYVAVKAWMVTVAEFLMFITHSSVPIFIFTSGVFCTISFSRLPFARAYKAILMRLRTILIPFTIWSVITSLFVHAAHQDINIQVILYEWITASANYTHYYIMQLLQLYLLAPLILFLLRRKPLPTLAAALLMMAVFDFLIISTTAAQSWRIDLLIRLFPYLLFYFSLGAYVGMHVEKVKAWILRFRPLFVIGMLLGLAFFSAETTFYSTTFHTYIFPRSAPISSFLFGVSFIFLLLSNEKWPAWITSIVVPLGGAIFAIYLTHSLVIFAINGLIHWVAPILIGQPVLYFLITVAFGLGLPLGAVLLLRRSPQRKYAPYLFG